MTTALERAFARGAFAVGDRLGVGGSTWHVQRSSGDGVTAARSSAAEDDITGTVRRSKKTVQDPTAPGVPVQVEIWLLTADDDQDVQIGDTITSAADSSLVFTVETREESPGYLRCEVQP